MCDYSLEMYRRRPAQKGERYQTHIFPSGSIGLIAPGDPATAVCVACDTGLRLHDLPETVRTAAGVDPQADAIFVRLDTGLYRDGVEFANGKRVSLQSLGRGVKVDVTRALDAPAWTPALDEEVA